LIDRKNLVEGDEIENRENDIEIVDYTDFFLINYISRCAEDFVEDGKNGIEIVDCVKSFLVNYIDRGAVSPYSVNFVIIITAVKTANIY
jgi:hypothetical protein